MKKVRGGKRLIEQPSIDIFDIDDKQAIISAKSGLPFETLEACTLICLAATTVILIFLLAFILYGPGKVSP